MAGRVLRDSNGRFAGSTGGWGRGRTSHGGGFGSRKGKVRSLKGYQRQQKALGVIRKGGSVGLAVGGTIAGAALAHKGASRGNLGLAVAGIAATTAGQVGVVASKRTLRR